MCEVSEGLSSGCCSRSQPVYLLSVSVGERVFILPSPGVYGVYVCVCMRVSSTSKPQVGPATSAAVLGHSRDIRQLEGPCWHLGRPVSVGCLWDNCVSAACWLLIIKPDQPVGRGTCEAGMGPRIQARVPSRQRICATTQESCKYVCACEPRECCVCAGTNEHLSLIPEEDLTVCVHILCEFCM